MTELGIEMIGSEAKSWLGVPLILGERVLGVITVQSYDTPNAYGEREKELLTAIASQTAIALQNASLFEKTSTHAAELAILNEMSQALASILDVDEVLEQAYHGASRLLRTTNFYIGLYDPDEEIITFKLHISESSEDKKFQTMSADQGLSGYIIQHREGLLIQENVEERMVELNITPVGEIAKSWLGVPMIVGDRVLGVMIVQSFSTSRAYDEDDWNLMQSIANQTAIALQNAYLFQETEAALAETETLYLVGETVSRLGALDETFQMLANVLVGQLGYTHAWLGIIDKQTQTLAEIASAGLRPSEQQTTHLKLDAQADLPVLQAISQCKSIVIDAEQSGSDGHLAEIPIMVGSEAAGVITVHRSSDGPGISQRNLGVLEAVADQAAVALQNSNLLEEIQRRATQLAAAAEVARDATSILDVDALLNQTVHLISEQFEFYHAGVFLVDDNQEYAVLHAASSEGGQKMLAKGHKLPVGKVGIVGNVAATGEPHIALDVGEDAVHFANPDLPETHSEMGLPLKVRNQVIGVLDVQSIQEAAFSEEDVAVLQTLADQLAAAIVNARLFQNVRTDAMRRALINEVQQAAAVSLNSEELLHRAGEVISRRLERPSAVFSWDEREQHLRPVAIHDERGEDVYLSGDARVTRKMAPSLLSEVIDKRHACVLDPVAHHLGRPALNLVERIGIEGGIYIPLTARDQVLGVLAIAQTDGHFSEGMEFAEMVGRNLSVALENARLYQEAIETTEKLQEMDRLKSQFLANMSHELRTPLNSIIGFSRVILKGIDGPLTDMQRTDLEAVYNSGQHLLELINSILDISKIQAGKMELSFEEIDLTEVIRVVMSTAKALIKDKAVELQQSIPQELPTIRADARRVRQILTNLVGNATKFTEEGFIKVEAELAGPEVIIRIIDTGVGIPEDKIETIFDEFTQVDGSSTRAVGGTGLGLSITRHFVEMHSGRIWVESTVDKGSTFYVALPIKGPPESTEEEITEEKATPIPPEEEKVEGPEPGQKVVLCVDDDEGVIMLFRRYLSKQGYYVIGVTEGQAVLDKIQTHKPFAITLDVMMPGRDGWQIIQDLKSNPDTCDIPVIICSIVSDQERGISLGASGYLVKPILEKDLLSALERLDQEDKQQKILVVDDHDKDRDLIRRMLESQERYSV
ncbi:MAG TPA: GAF domain-containing protein, partial [Chloroflexi bacterium]|nr:GAF domain-containing protein [Chloroflexota bacterium]